MKTIRETAAIFRVNERTIRNWIRDGKIRTIKIKGTIRISEDEIERLLNPK